MTPVELAERYLLGLLLRRPERIVEVGPHLASSDFADLRHAAVFTVIREHLAGRTDQLAQARAARPEAHHWAPVLLAVVPEFTDYNISGPELATYRAVAPHGGGQPDVYAELILEASIRRQVTMLGYEAARLSAQTPQLAELRAAHDTINAHLSSVEQRWEAITQTRNLVRALTTTEAGPGAAPDVDLFGRPVLPTPATPAPSEEELHAAQEQVIGNILYSPGVADALLGRLEPTDFPNVALGNALEGARQVHAQAAVTGRQVDPVTVAWALQALPEARGPTPSPEYLHELAHDAEPNDLDSAVDLVMRAALAKATTEAATTAQRAAQQAGLAPADVLATTRSAYQAVDAAARRMTGRTSNDYQLGVLNNRAAHTGPARSTATLAGLRSRSTALLQQATAGPTGPETTVHPGIGARLDPVVGAEHPGVDKEVHTDAGPDLA